jgi:hypothetical protein
MISLQDIILGLVASCLPSLVIMAALDFGDEVDAEESTDLVAVRSRDATR